MSARRDRRNRGRKRKRSKSQSVSPGQLLEQARRSLSGGDGRKALDLLRQARHADEHPEELPLLAFCACTLRARQLAAKGMEKEAAAMRSRAAQHRASISARTLPEDDLVLYLLHLDGAEALETYADYLAAGPSVPRVERALADRLVALGSWEGLEALDAGHPLRRDAGPVAHSLEAMDAGGLGASRRTPARGVPAFALRALAAVLQGHGVFRRRRRRGAAPDHRSDSG